MVGDHDRNIGCKFSRMVADEQVEETMVEFRDQDHHSRAIVESPDPQLTVELLNAGVEVGGNLARILEIVLEHSPHHKGIRRVVRELFVRDDVRVQLEQTGSKARNDAAGVGAFEGEDELVHEGMRLPHAGGTLLAIVNKQGTALRSGTDRRRVTVVSQ